MRTASFLAAAAAFILTAIDPLRFSRAAGIIHTMLWLYAFAEVLRKLAARIPAPASSGRKPARPCAGIIAFSAAAWAVLLAAGYTVFRLLPFANFSLLAAAVAFLGLLEIFFINTWCPFSKLITRAHCCRSCRLQSWGEAMVLSPLAVMPSLWTLSLVALAFALLIKYEVAYHIHPQLNPANRACKDCTEPCRVRNSREPGAETITP